MIKIDVNKLSGILEGLKLISNNSESTYKNKYGEKVKVIQIDNTWFISNNIIRIKQYVK
ncbi:hypothetical protein [Clostridium gasigenes]|uniref:hypothetical protein n=1 Tax=Clostridium gasigenes TaxID=94869 RepID=UPI001C0DF71F|nr:hypothetical protein [Clostridium gasigenes]MBU3106632.1 hypothetical protein [Clostridium gasigenes]